MGQPEHISRSLDVIEETALRYEVERLRREVSANNAALAQLRTDVESLRHAVRMTNGSLANGYES